MRKLVVAALSIASVVLGWRALRDSNDPKLVFDRAWIDHIPKNATDRAHAFFISSERPAGQFEIFTWWRGEWEAFHYHVQPRAEGEFDFLFGGSKEIERVRVTVRACKQDEFDLCLDLEGSEHGVKHYFSKREWKGADAAALPWRAACL